MQTAGLYLISPSGDVFTNPLFLLATRFAGTPSSVSSELPLDGGRSVEVWISPDAAKQFHFPYSYSLDPINTVDPTGFYSMYQKEDGTFDRVPDWMDMFSENKATVDVAVMNERTRSVFDRAGIQDLTTEWRDMVHQCLDT